MPFRRCQLLQRHFHNLTRFNNPSLNLIEFDGIRGRSGWQELPNQFSRGGNDRDWKVQRLQFEGEALVRNAA